MIINFYSKYFSIPFIKWEPMSCLPIMRKATRPYEQAPERTFNQGRLDFVYTNVHHPVRTRIRTGPRYLLVVVWGDSKGRSFGWERKIWGPRYNRCGTRKAPPCSNALLSAEHRPKAQYERNVLNGTW